jgi:hypothetical protein
LDAVRENYEATLLNQQTLHRIAIDGNAENPSACSAGKHLIGRERELTCTLGGQLFDIAEILQLIAVNEIFGNPRTTDFARSRTQRVSGYPVLNFLFSSRRPAAKSQHQKIRFKSLYTLSNACLLKIRKSNLPRITFAMMVGFHGGKQEMSNATPPH